MRCKHTRAEFQGGSCASKWEVPHTWAPQPWAGWTLSADLRCLLPLLAPAGPQGLTAAQAGGAAGRRSGAAAGADRGGGGERGAAGAHRCADRPPAGRDAHERREVRGCACPCVPQRCVCFAGLEPTPSPAQGKLLGKRGGGGFGQPGLYDCWAAGCADCASSRLQAAAAQAPLVDHPIAPARAAFPAGPSRRRRCGPRRRSARRWTAACRSRGAASRRGWMRWRRRCRWGAM